MTLRRLLIPTSTFAVFFLILFFQNCGKFQVQNWDVSNQTNTLDLDSESLLKIAVGSKCSFFILESGTVFFAGTNEGGCIEVYNDYKFPKIVSATPVEAVWLPKDVTDVKLSYHNYPFVLTRGLNVYDFFGEKIMGDVKEVKVGAFGRISVMKSNGSVFTRNTSTVVALPGTQWTEILAFKDAQSFIAHYLCDYKNCAVVSGTVVCSEDGVDPNSCNGGGRFLGAPVDLNTGVDSIEGSLGENVYALKSGAVYPFTSPLTPLKNLESGVTFIYTYLRSACAIKAGDIFCWGENKNGQLGTGNKESVRIPQQITTSGKFVSLSLSDSHACALTSSNEIWCWGSNSSGQFGNGSMSDSLSPARVVATFK